MGITRTLIYGALIAGIGIGAYKMGMNKGEKNVLPTKSHPTYNVVSMSDKDFLKDKTTGKTLEIKNIDDHLVVGDLKHNYVSIGKLLEEKDTLFRNNRTELNYTKQEQSITDK